MFLECVVIHFVLLLYLVVSHLSILFTGHSQTDVSLALQRQLDSNNIRDLLEQLKRCPAGLDQSLKKSVSFGVAFHHAGAYNE